MSLNAVEVFNGERGFGEERPEVLRVYVDASLECPATGEKYSVLSIETSAAGARLGLRGCALEKGRQVFIRLMLPKMEREVRLPGVVWGVIYHDSRDVYEVAVKFRRPPLEAVSSRESTQENAEASVGLSA